MENPMTPSQALQILSDATEPATQGKISRQGYIAIQTAIEVLASAIKQPEPSDSNDSND